MGLDYERISFSIRIVFAKFRAIPSSFDPGRGCLQFRKNWVFCLENSYHRDFGFVGKFSSR